MKEPTARGVYTHWHSLQGYLENRQKIWKGNCRELCAGESWSGLEGNKGGERGRIKMGVAFVISELGQSSGKTLLSPHSPSGTAD